MKPLMPTNHEHVEHIKVLLRRWSRLLEQGPYSIHANSRSDGRARKFPNGANANSVGMMSDARCPGE
eukprot:12932654-Prorocentrum_lima.AAC.1